MSKVPILVLQGWKFLILSNNTEIPKFINRNPNFWGFWLKNKKSICATSMAAVKVIGVSCLKDSGEFTFLQLQSHFYAKNGSKLQIARKFLEAISLKIAKIQNNLFLKQPFMEEEFKWILLPFKTRLPDVKIFGVTISLKFISTDIWKSLDPWFHEILSVLFILK